MRQVSLKCLVIFYAWHDVEFCPLMHIRRNRRIINRPPIIMRINGTITTITSPADALCYLYTINYPLPKKKKKNTDLSFIPNKKRKKRKEFTYQSQVKFLFRHQDQICQWIDIIELNHWKCPAKINVSQKSNQKKIINVAFGATITARNRNQRRQLVAICQQKDQYLLPQNQNGSVILTLEANQKFRNCTEMNAQTFLYQ